MKFRPVKMPLRSKAAWRKVAGPGSTYPLKRRLCLEHADHTRIRFAGANQSRRTGSSVVLRVPMGSVRTSAGPIRS